MTARFRARTEDTSTRFPELLPYRGGIAMIGNRHLLYTQIEITVFSEAFARRSSGDGDLSGYRTLSTRIENSPNRRPAAEAQTVRTISYEEVRRDKVIIGGPEYVADRLEQLHEELALNGILAELNFGALIPPEPMTRSLQLLCENVMPRFH
jgi:alkanesulfonate monooxygenase SsuD/methylene tetrahydromethanopterin reductase-like flavin-dependent oxidoreductase (luciferase family)